MYSLKVKELLHLLQAAHRNPSNHCQNPPLDVESEMLTICVACITDGQTVTCSSTAVVAWESFPKT